MFESARTTNQQGNIGVGAAIAAFCKRNWVVSIPLNDTQCYDLLVDDGEGIKKVQVKTSCYIRHGNYVVKMSSTRSARRGNDDVAFDNSKVDYVFVLLGDGSQYLIPSSKLTCTKAFAVNDAYKDYRE